MGKPFENIQVSIIVPTYNRAKLIHRAINSISKQSFEQWECIIVDDNSTDDTKKVIADLIGDDKRFTIIDNTRKKGAPGARNSGILVAHGNYVLLFDSDNVMHPDFLEKVYGQLIKEDADICSSFSTVIDEETGEKIGEFKWEGYGNVHKRLLEGKCYFDNSSTIIKRQKLYDIGLLDENCPSFQEWETHIRLSNNSVYTMVKEYLVDYYRGGGDTISKSFVRSIKGRQYIYDKYRDEFLKTVPYSFLMKNIRLYSMIKETEGRDEYYTLKENFEKYKGWALLILIKFLSQVRKFKLSLFNNNINETA